MFIPSLMLATGLTLTPAQAPVSAASPYETQALAHHLRVLLLKHLPDPLVQSAPGWGQQKPFTEVKFHRDGLKLRTERLPVLRNDGTWRRITVKAVQPEQSLALGLQDVLSPQAGLLTLTAMIGLNCEFRFEQQLWSRGLRLYSGETRGRCRGALLLRCELASRTEAREGSLLPDVVLRLRVNEAQVFYDQLEVTHTAGIGGDGAKLLGAAVIDTIKQVKPSLERDLLAKANAAIVKAGDSKEIRVELHKLLEGKPPTITRQK